MSKPTTPVPQIERSTAGLREAMFATLDDLRAGRCDARHAKAVADLGKTIVTTVAVQLAYEKARLESKVPAILPEMRLVPALPAAKKHDAEGG